MVEPGAVAKELYLFFVTAVMTLGTVGAVLHYARKALG